MKTAMEKSRGKWDREEKLKMTVIRVSFLSVLIPDVLYSTSRLMYLIRSVLAFFIEVLLAASLLPEYADVEGNSYCSKVNVHLIDMGNVPSLLSNDKTRY